MLRDQSLIHLQFKNKNKNNSWNGVWAWNCKLEEKRLILEEQRPTEGTSSRYTTWYNSFLSCVLYAKAKLFLFFAINLLTIIITCFLDQIFPPPLRKHFLQLNRCFWFFLDIQGWHRNRKTDLILLKCLECCFEFFLILSCIFGQFGSTDTYTWR